MEFIRIRRGDCRLQAAEKATPLNGERSKQSLLTSMLSGTVFASDVEVAGANAFRRKTSRRNSRSKALLARSNSCKRSGDRKIETTQPLARGTWGTCKLPSNLALVLETSPRGNVRAGKLSSSGDSCLLFFLQDLADAVWRRYKIHLTKKIAVSASL